MEKCFLVTCKEENVSNDKKKTLTMKSRQEKMKREEEKMSESKAGSKKKNSNTELAIKK